MRPRNRVVIYALAGVVGIWLAAWAGYRFFANAKVTADKVAAYLRETDLARLSGQARARALRELADKMNGLSAEERRRARLEGEWERWFNAMTEEEKGAFIEATLPSGFKQMLASFEEMPEEKRHRAVEEALKGLERARQAMESQDPSAQTWPRNERMGQLSPELREKVVKVGLRSFYTESSAQTKAELAPVLEEMQRLMERGAMLRGGRR